MVKTTLAVAAALLLSVAGAQAQSASARAILGACKPDIKKFCSDVQPGDGRVKACMKEHVHELSEPCKEAIFKGWLNK